MRNFLFVLGALLSLSFGESEVLDTIAHWPLLDFALPYDRAFLNEYRAENVVPTGFAVAWHRIFISIPRLRAGVPATLSVIPRDIPLGSSPQLQAYPSWEWHIAGKGEFNCSLLISVYRVNVDRCNRLWVLDSGINTSIDDFRVVCPPKLLIFDLQTDTLVRSYVFPRRSLRPHSLLTNLVIDDTSANTCDDVWVYLTDTTGSGLMVFDAANDRSWRFQHASMFPDPDYATYQIAGDSFELFDGIVGLAFSPRQRRVYYQPLATDRMFSVPASVLQAGPLPFGEQLPVSLVGRKSSQGLAMAVDTRDDTILFSPLTETAIASWNPHSNNQRIIAYQPEQFQFVAELRLVDRDDGNIWLLSTRFQKFFNRRVNNQEINLRILRIRPESRDHSPVPHRLDPYALNLYNNTLPLLLTLIQIDECDRLWVLDTGKIEEEHVCPAQLLAFDLHTDRLLKRVKIPRSIARNTLTNQGLFVTPVVETEGVNCEKTHVYMADTTGNGLVIYNGTTLWRLESPAFAFQEAAANFTVAGDHFYLDDGVLGMALSPPVSPRENYRHLMLRPLASFDMVSAETSNLHQSHSAPVRYTLVSGALPSQAAGMAFSASGVLFFGLIQEHAIACWDMHKPIAPENIVSTISQDAFTQFHYFLISIASNTIETNIMNESATQGFLHCGSHSNNLIRVMIFHGEFRIATNRYQKIALDVQNFNDVNFRVMSRRLDSLIRGTSCDSQSNLEHLFRDAEDTIWDYSHYLWNLANAEEYNQ
ncbi:uncharacterized protein yellow-e [Fopius arisanus]|uniref:Uncharacterized protein yellow-e n=1 Tax=Fopius arisanus TaxID=64838 RepID=A0A9R1TJU0_9HYME|nr:PREDICTED: uncharacterized protein LOC105271126 [Fopius arisanus]